MLTRRMEPATASLPPFPEGWYFVAAREAVRKAGLIQTTWMGVDVVAWCGGDGRVSVAESVCPHLGSSLGPEAGGRVCEGRIVCPFHGYEFDAGGQCVATPFAPPPRSARLRVFETRDVCGLIFAWWGAGGRSPQWRLPEEAPEQDGWSSLEIRTLRFPGHPQETTENSVDLAHLRYVHGYANVTHTEPAAVDGPCLTTRFGFRRIRTIAGVAKLTFDVSASTSIFGLGYSFVEIREHSIGMDTRLWILATPIDGTLIDVSLVSQVREMRKPQRPIAGLGFLPVGLRAPLMNTFIVSQQRKDVLQDVVIWSRKQYRPRPRLCRSDGEITAYRDWCAQFYPDPRECEAPPVAMPAAERAATPSGTASRT